MDRSAFEEMSEMAAIYKQSQNGMVSFKNRIRGARKFAKVEVAGSNPVVRSKEPQATGLGFMRFGAPRDRRVCDRGQAGDAKIGADLMQIQLEAARSSSSEENE